MIWETGTIETNGINTNYIRTGGNKPALVIAHGITDNGATWTRTARELAPTYDVILYDQRGHGLSEAPAQGYTFTDYAADLTDLFAALNLEHAHVLGHSSGAAIATLFAAENSARVDTLILEDPAWGTAWGDWDAVKNGLAQWFLSIKQMSREDLVASCQETYPTWLQEEVDRWVESKLQVHPNVVQTMEQPAPRWTDAIGKLSCPTLLITGDLERGALNTPADVEMLKQACRHARVVNIEGAGHVIHHDRFDIYLTTITSFISASMS